MQEKVVPVPEEHFMRGKRFRHATTPALPAAPPIQAQITEAPAEIEIDDALRDEIIEKELGSRESIYPEFGSILHEALVRSRDDKALRAKIESLRDYFENLRLPDKVNWNEAKSIAIRT